jgi:hypothetical protein
MNKIHSVIIISILIFTSAFSQGKISPSEYNSEMDRLQNLKKNLLLEKEELSSEVKILSEELSELENKLILAKRDLYIAKYGEEDGINVSYGRVWKGMTEEMLMDSWGKPDKIEKNVEKWGVFTQWYYGVITYYFRDGILTEGEEKKK